MTDTTTVGQWPDGWWKSVHMHYPPEYAVVRWETGQLAKYNSDNNGMIYEPVHILTDAEHDALNTELAKLRAENEALRTEVEGWETCDIDSKSNLITRAQFRGLEAQGWQLRHKRGEVGDGA